MIKLTITEKGGDTRALSFDKDEVSIGRVQGNDIVLPKGNISKRHTKLSFSNGRISIADLKSTNGTYVNGRRISEPMSVKAGDKVFVGDFLIVIDPNEAAAEISGSRRGPPPPPPPPRASASGAAAAAYENEAAVQAEADAALDASAAGLVGLGSSRGRPLAPPPPPPRRTVVTSALLGDSFDMGAEAPPSPADVAADAADDVGEDGASPAEGEGHATTGEENGAGRGVAFAGADAQIGAGATAGEDDEVAAARMFGTAPAVDEDAVSPADGPVAGLEDAALARSPSEVVDAPAEPAPGDEAGQVALPTLEGLLLDAGVTAIIIAPNGTVQVERTGLWESIAGLGDGTSLAERVWQLANTAVPPPPSENPVVDVRLPDGTRVTALFPPITPLSVCAAIRKSTVPELSLAEVSGHGDVERILTAALASRRNILLAGDRPALGALAGAMAGAIPAESQVLSIGAGTRYRPGWIELAPGGEPAALIRAASAFRADHLLVADPEGGDLPDLLLVAARGQGGIVAAVSARSVSEALTRLRAFSVGVVGAEAFVPLVASTIDLVVFAAMDRGGRVRVVEVVEPVGHGAELTSSVVARRGNLGHSEPAWDLRGISSRLGEAIAVASDPLPAHLVRPH